MKKIDLNENEVVFAPKGGRPGYLINGKWFPVNKDDLNSPALKRELERYARLRGQEQLKRDQESIKSQSSQSSQSTQPPKPQFSDLRGGNKEVDGYGKPKVDYTKIKVEPYKEPETTPPTTPPTSTPKNLTPQQRAYGDYSKLTKDQQAANLEYDKKRYETDDKGNPIIGKLRTDPKEARAARNFGLKKNIENFPNQRVFVRPDDEPKKSATDKTSSGAGSYAAYQQNVLKNLGSDYGRLPQNTIKPVVKRTMKKEAYDVVLDYLLSEGHVDTVEEAHYVMLQMTSEHVQDIVEGKYSDSVTYVKGTAPVRASYGGKPESFTKETYKKKGKV